MIVVHLILDNPPLLRVKGSKFAAESARVTWWWLWKIRREKNKRMEVKEKEKAKTAKGRINGEIHNVRGKTIRHIWLTFSSKCIINMGQFLSIQLLICLWSWLYPHSVLDRNINKALSQWYKFGEHQPKQMWIGDWVFHASLSLWSDSFLFASLKM